MQNISIPIGKNISLEEIAQMIPDKYVILDLSYYKYEGVESSIIIHNRDEFCNKKQFKYLNEIKEYYYDYFDNDIDKIYLNKNSNFISIEFEDSLKRSLKCYKFYGFNQDLFEKIIKIFPYITTV